MDEREFLDERQDQWEAAIRAEHHLSRRQALRLAAAGTVLVATGMRGGAAAAATTRAGGAGTPVQAATSAQAVARPVPGVLKAQPIELLIPRGTNVEMQWTAMKRAGYRTPVDRFFVRNHTRTPVIDASTWSLALYGDGLAGAPTEASPRRLGLEALQKLEPVELDASIECAGNGRSYFGSQQGKAAPGTAWTLGAIGVGTWRGVRLADVLELAGLQPGTVDVMPIGLDPEVPGSGAGAPSQGHVRRPLPLAKALRDAIIAFEMNGETLPADHGFPARLVVPGWVGIASTKWLGAIEVAKRPLFSPWNTTQYRLAGPGYPPDSPPLTANPLKSAFELPSAAVLPVRRHRVLTGRSWSGRSLPERVEVSTDSGYSWRDARLHRRNQHDAWVRWEVDWTPKTRGARTILARAHDRRGRAQPDATRFNRDGYWFDAVVRQPVTIA